MIEIIPTRTRSVQIFSWVIFLISISLPAQSISAQKCVLVLHSYHDGLSWTNDLKQGINNGFEKLDKNLNVEVIHEYLDAKNHPELRYGKDLLALIEHKYEHLSIDLVMVSDDPGLRLLLKHRNEYFSNVPVVFLGINKVDHDLMRQPNMVGVFEIHDTTETVLGALKQTNMNRLIVVNDTTTTGQANLDALNY